mmetsp:Transcript_5512/g.14954  ORF Transcript_5512/g.14954 Transcript_5512/m.14954 type:complete len:97 (-) Transcript_5512:275-565(-)
MTRDDAIHAQLYTSKNRLTSISSQSTTNVAFAMHACGIDQWIHLLYAVHRHRTREMHTRLYSAYEHAWSSRIRTVVDMVVLEREAVLETSTPMELR